MAAKDISKNVSHKSNSEFSHDNSHTLKDFPDRHALYFCLFIWLASSSRALILMVPPLMLIRNLHLHRSHPMNVTIFDFDNTQFYGLLDLWFAKSPGKSSFPSHFMFVFHNFQNPSICCMLCVQVQGKKKKKQQKKNKRKENTLLTMPS